MRRQTDLEVLKKTMQGKDLWMIRALVLAKRLKDVGLAADDVVDCKDKTVLYQELINKEETCFKEFN